jgi:hypothetical protein
MCDPELDDMEFNTHENMNFNTKCHLLIKIKDYPIGKNMKCYVWFEGAVDKKEIENKVKNCLTLSETYKDYAIAEISVVNNVMTNTRMEKNENFGEIILQSISNVYEGNPKKQKEKKHSFKDIKYSDLTDKDIEEIDKKLTIEMFKRQHKLNDSEYRFYIENKDEVDLEKVKEVYEKCGGDIFKLRKDKIRENIANLLKNKKVV